MKMKNLILFLMLFSMLIGSSLGAIPLSLNGEIAGCDVNPTYENLHYFNGETISLEQEGCMFEIVKVDSNAVETKLTEYQDKFTFVHSLSHVVVVRYCNCDFSQITIFNNGGCGWWNAYSCDDGYYCNNGYCDPQDSQRELTQQEYCLAQEKYWYDDSCHDENNPIKKGAEATEDFIDDLINNFKNEPDWAFGVIAGIGFAVYMIRKKKGGN